MLKGREQRPWLALFLRSHREEERDLLCASPNSPSHLRLPAGGRIDRSAQSMQEAVRYSNDESWRSDHSLPLPSTLPPTSLYINSPPHQPAEWQSSERRRTSKAAGSRMQAIITTPTIPAHPRAPTSATSPTSAMAVCLAAHLSDRAAGMEHHNKACRRTG